jgi:hypothetical protein
MVLLIDYKKCIVSKLYYSRYGIVNEAPLTFLALLGDFAVCVLCLTKRSIAARRQTFIQWEQTGGCLRRPSMNT